jgi:predicted transcriptional regulator YdeE
LWRDFDTKKEELFNIFGYRNDFYGLMWYTDNHRYYNLIGIEADNINKKPTGACGKCVPGTNHSVAHVPPIMSAVDAWTEYFEKTLPESGYFIVFLPTLQILT